jgi:hypothetical protein
MLADPAEEPITSPVDELTVATAGLLLLQLPPATVELNVLVPATQIDWVPLNTPAVGAAVTVTVLVAVPSGHPPVPVTV